MAFLLEIDTGNATHDEMRAVASLLLTLAGGASTVALATVPPPPALAAPLPPPVADNAPLTPAAAGDALMAAESARVAALNPAGEVPAGAGGALGLDAEGLPWDARIHSSNQKKTAKGVWVARRNLDAGTNAQVRAELLAAVGAPPAVPIGQAPPPPVAGAAPPPPVAAAAPLPPTTAAAPPPPVAAAAPAADYSTAVFSDLMLRVVDLQQSGVMTAEEVTAACVALGLAQIRDFAVRADLIPSMMAMLPVPPAAAA